MREVSLIRCSSLVNAFGPKGRRSRAVDLYARMSDDMRNEITRTCVLNACSHSGLLNEIRSIFEKISPKTVKITTAMVIDSELSLQLLSCCLS